MKSRNTKLVSLLLIVSVLLALLPTASAAKLELPAEQDAKAIIPVTDSFLTDSGCQIGKYIDTVAFEAKNHVSRLKADEDLNTYVFLNEDNTKTVYYMDEAVKYVDEDGYVREKLTDLSFHLTGFSTVQNDVELDIPTLTASGIKMSYGGSQITIYPLNGNPLSIGVLSGNSVVYPLYYGLGTTLRYTPTLSGVKEDIILSSYNGVHEFSFRITTGGLNLYQVNNRYYLAETEDADTKFWLGCVEIFDANARPGYGTMTAETVKAGQEYILTLSADPAFLTDPNTVYPVTIDPTVEGGIFSDNANGISSIEDAPIFEGYPDSNFGTYQYNRAGYVDSSYKVGRTLVRLNSLMNDSNFKTAAVINSVEFHIWDASGSAPTTVNLHPMTSNETWTETSITWYTQGSYDTDPNLSSSASVGYGNELIFNITNLVKKWREKPAQTAVINYRMGFILKAANESSGDRALYSSEHSTSSKRPYVVANYTYFARSGAELPYHDACWNVTGIIDVANCYSYALNYTEDHLLVGELYNSPMTYEETSFPALGDFIEEDLNTYCYYIDEKSGERVYLWGKLTDSNKYDAIPAGTYRIAACLNYSKGWHFFRQNSDGSWSHKNGQHNPVTNLDSSGNIIYNPEDCNVPYNTTQMHYFYIRPICENTCTSCIKNHVCGCVGATCQNRCTWSCRCPDS